MFRKKWVAVLAAAMALADNIVSWQMPHGGAPGLDRRGRGTRRHRQRRHAVGAGEVRFCRFQYRAFG